MISKLPAKVMRFVNSAATLQRCYTTALTRKVSYSLTDALSMNPPPSPVDINIALAQHEDYVKVLREKVGLNTIEIDADDNYPDCVFIEDTAVIISNVAVINRIGAISRQGEVDAVKDVLIRLGLTVHDMREADSEQPCLDGGDVLFPVDFKPNNERIGGEHLFVGISSRTNQNGADYLSEIFPDISVIPVDIKHLGSLHLKSIVTHLDANTLLIPKGNLGDDIAIKMNAEAIGYELIRLNDIAACNVVTTKSTILAQPTSCYETKQALESAAKERGKSIEWVNMNEFSKLDGALTCQSILM
jgi:dimethylargininase